MAFANTIDRLEYTRRRFAKQLGLEDEVKEAPKTKTHENELDVCPFCGSHSLRRDGGCMSCLSCGWSACHSS